MRVLVTGGAGFIGSNLVDALVARGDEVTVLDDLSSGKASNLASAIGSRRTPDRRETSPIPMRSRRRSRLPSPSACSTSQHRSTSGCRSADPVFDLGVNVGGTINLLEASVRAGVKKFLFASTGGAIYGEGDGRDLPLDEDADAAARCSLRPVEARRRGLPRPVLRGCTDWRRLRCGSGTCTGRDRILTARPASSRSSAERCSRASTPKVFGDGLQTRDYIYVGDVVDAFLAASDSTATGAFNIGTGREATVFDVGEAIASAYGVEFEPGDGGRSRRRGTTDRDLARRRRVPSSAGSRKPALRTACRTAEWARSATTAV